MTFEEAKETYRMAHEMTELAPEASIMKLTKKELVGVNEKEKSVDFSYKVTDNALNVIHSLAGGIVAALMDETMAFCVNVHLGNRPGEIVTTGINMSSVKPIFGGDEIIIHAQVLHSGKRLQSARAEIYRGEDLCAYATASFMKVAKLADQFEKEQQQ